MLETFKIAIDVPAGAGKTSVAKALSYKLGFKYIDTGAMYRMIALGLKNAGINPFVLDSESLKNELNKFNLDLYQSGLDNRYILNETDVTDKIRTEEISQLASKVSAIQLVRTHLLEAQQSMAASSNCIMEGRDIGTVVLPDAQLKIFLTADVESRAIRRCNDILTKDPTQSLSLQLHQEILRALKERDKRDMSRDAAPLKPAEDSIWLDDTHLTFDQTVEIIYALAVKRFEESSWKK